MDESVTHVKIDDLLEKANELKSLGYDYARLSIIWDNKSDALDGAVKLGGFNAASEDESLHFCTPVYVPDLDYYPL